MTTYPIGPSGFPEWSPSPDVRIINGDCVEVMRTLEESSVDSVVCDPPYGLEFMGKEWDRLGWQAGGGFSKPGIGGRPTEWTSFSSTSRFGAANPTCGKCGGRLRGKKRCACEEPEWKPIGKRRNPENEGLPDDVTGGGYARQLSAMQQWHHAWAVEALRVLKPGGHLLAFGGTRTYHRLACAIEDSGFEIRDCIFWCYGSGFPKSLDVSKAIDKAAGAEREVVGYGSNGMGRMNQNNAKAGYRPNPYSDGVDGVPVTAPATEAARQWQGWGTALKPACEPCIVARKPLIGTVAQNVLTHGTGALNIDWCRVAANGDNLGGGRVSTTTEGWDRPWKHDAAAIEACRERGEAAVAKAESLGRWPANLIHDGSEEVVGLFPETKSGWCNTDTAPSVGSVYGNDNRDRTGPHYADASGSAARFFYTAKADKQQRSGSKHPTVKPLALMRYLVRLVTPPGGIVLDPFLGSGTTAVAAYQEAFRCIGIEREAEYFADAVRRVQSERDGFALLEPARQRQRELIP